MSIYFSLAVSLTLLIAADSIFFFFSPNKEVEQLATWIHSFPGSLPFLLSFFQVSAQFTKRIQTKIKDLLQQMEEGLKTADPHDCSAYTGWTGEKAGMWMFHKCCVFIQGASDKGAAEVLWYSHLYELFSFNSGTLVTVVWEWLSLTSVDKGSHNRDNMLLYIEICVLQKEWIFKAISFGLPLFFFF